MGLRPVMILSKKSSIFCLGTVKDRPSHFIDNNHFAIYGKQTIYAQCRKILKLFVRALKTSRKTNYHVSVVVCGVVVYSVVVSGVDVESVVVCGVVVYSVVVSGVDVESVVVCVNTFIDYQINICFSDLITTTIASMAESTTVTDSRTTPETTTVSTTLQTTCIFRRCFWC
jgi:hypothetical protein